jgi:hypothetical protein
MWVTGPSYEGSRDAGGPRLDDGSRAARLPRQGLLVRHPLVCFFVMAYAFSWLVWSPWVLGKDGAGLLPTELSRAATGYLNAAAFLAGPTLAAFIMTAATESRAGVRRLLSRLVLWRVSLRWYPFALVRTLLLGTRVNMGC